MTQESYAGEQAAAPHPFAETLHYEEVGFFEDTLGPHTPEAGQLHGDAVRAFYISDELPNPLLHNLSVNTMRLMALDAAPGLDYGADATYDARKTRASMSGIALLQTMRASYWEDSVEETQKLLHPATYTTETKNNLKTAIKGSFELIDERFFSGPDVLPRTKLGYDAVVDQINLEMACQLPIIDAILTGDQEVVRDTAKRFHQMRNKLEAADPSLTQSAFFLAKELANGKSPDWAVDAFDDDAPAIVNLLSDIQALTNAGVFLQVITDLPDKQQTFADLLRRIGEVGGYIPRAPAAETTEETDRSGFQPMEVDWEILPPGDLQDVAIAICTTLQERGHTNVEIDLNRLRALDILRESWGKDRSYFVTGSLKERGVIKQNGQEAPDEYIILIVQDLDDNGLVMGEHAVAESPIAGKHASYVFRYDIDGLSWREVMAYDKREARYFNARQVKHTKINGILTPEMTAAKFSTLLQADADYFLNGEFNGGNLRIRKQVLDHLIDSAIGE